MLPPKVTRYRAKHPFVIPLKVTTPESGRWITYPFLHRITSFVNKTFCNAATVCAATAVNFAIIQHPFSKNQGGKGSHPCRRIIIA
jgi:hypothetical protein